MIIEEIGTGGTASGQFFRRHDVAWVDWDSENRIATLTSVGTYMTLAEIDVAYMIVHSGYDGSYLGHAADWHGAVRLALGQHGYGYSWYQVKGRSRTYVPAQTS